MKSFAYIIFVILVLNCKHSENARILSVLPLPTKSHFVMFHKIFKELALRGHEVDVVTPVEGFKTVPGLNIIPMKIAPLYAEFMQSSIEKLRSFSVQTSVRKMFAEDTNICEECFKSDVLKQIRDSKKKYDLLILEIFVTDCIHGFAHIFKAPIISVTTSVDLPWGTSRIGNPDNPAYISSYFGKFMKDLTLYERIINTLYTIETKLLHRWFLRKEQIDARKFFGDDLPQLEDLVANTSVFLINSHFSANQARPNVPNAIEVGGLHIEEPKNLDKRFLNFIGDSKFIYFSLGSLIGPEYIPIQKLQNILDVFEKVNYKVLWKVDKAKIPKKLKVPGNVLVEKWMPQVDILCHPNVLFFLTHNGLLSTQESVYCGVPMLSIPTFCDQFLNANTMVQKEIAIEIPFETVTKNELFEAMKNLIEDEKYKKNALKLSEQFKDRPRKPLDEAVYWIEYVLRYNGAPQLKTKSIDLYWFQYYLLDVLGIFTVCILSIVYIICVVFRGIFKCVFKNQSNKLKMS